MIPRDPIDGPSTESEACDCCAEPWALEVDRDHGPRKLRLCEDHATRWLRAEVELDAELEEMRGRSSFAPFYGLARAFDGRTKRSA